MLLSNRRFIKNVGPLQRRILVWAGRNSPWTADTLGRHLYLWNRIRYSEAVQEGPTKGYAITREASRALEREVGRLSASHKQRIHPRRHWRELEEGRPWIRWASRHLRQDTGESEQPPSFSHSLDSLERKGLLARRNAAGGLGKQRRTEAVRLTESGASLALALIVAIADQDESNAHILAIVRQISSYEEHLAKIKYESIYEYDED